MSTRTHKLINFTSEIIIYYEFGAYMLCGGRLFRRELQKLSKTIHPLIAYIIFSVDVLRTPVFDKSSCLFPTNQ